MVNNWEIILRLILASMFGGLIGLDRESTNRPAGFRTHILVCIGSALIMLVSIENSKYGADPSRIAAQVVSGIGFLGAGTILRTGTNIEGLTTAASLWVCAGIGLATGLGYYLGAAFTTLAVLFFLRYSKIFERKFLKNSYKSLEVIGLTRAGLIGDIGTIFGRYNIIPHNIDLNKIIQELTLIKGILRIKVDNRVVDIKA
ncbi:MAG: MgtC/SapB family protein [Tissierellaceae bacterium]|nr:MgtC/SapB family protein [Tissierellaceae bacterium]